MRHRQPALGHHLHQVSQAQLKTKIPAHAQDNDAAVEVATLEQLFYSLQLGHCRPRLVQPASIADRTVPFAPEPPIAGLPFMDVQVDDLTALPIGELAAE